MNQQYQNNSSTGVAVDALIADYVAGRLTMPAQLLVDAHMEIVPESRKFAATLEDIAGHALDEITPSPIAKSGAMLDAIFDAPDAPLPPALQLKYENSKSGASDWLPGALNNLLDEAEMPISWRMKLPGVYVHRLPDRDGCEIQFLKIKPGYAVPTHTHEGRELTLVLKGSFHDGGGTFGRGDIAVADAAIDHKPVAGPGEDCICFIVNDAPLRFTGFLARFLSVLRHTH